MPPPACSSRRRIFPACAISLLFAPSVPADAPAAAERVVAAGAALAVAATEPGATLEAALGGGLLVPVAGGAVTAPAAAGDHWLALAARDTSGNRSPFTWIRLRVDADPPRLAVEFEPPPVAGADGRLWSAPGTRAVAVADDAPAGVEWTAVDVGEGRLEAAGGRAEATLSGSGSRAVSAAARDRVGHEAAAVAREVWLDADPPRAELAIEGARVETPSGPVVGPAAVFSLVAEDADSGLAETSLTAGGVRQEGARAAGPWPGGPLTLAGEAVDRVGHRTEPAPLRVEIDDRGPEIRWSARGTAEAELDGRRFLRPPVTLAVAAVDAPAGVAELLWAEGEGPWRPWAGDATVPGEGVGLLARDRVGNPTRVEALWRVDGTPPELTLEDSAGGPVVAGAEVAVRLGGELRLSARDAGAGLGRLLHAVGSDAPWIDDRVADDGVVAIRFREPGRFALRAQAQDRLGNEARAGWTVRVSAEGRVP